MGERNKVGTAEREQLAKYDYQTYRENYRKPCCCYEMHRIIHLINRRRKKNCILWAWSLISMSVIKILKYVIIILGEISEKFCIMISIPDKAPNNKLVEIKTVNDVEMSREVVADVNANAAEAGCNCCFCLPCCVIATPLIVAKLFLKGLIWFFIFFSMAWLCVCCEELSNEEEEYIICKIYKEEIRSSRSMQADISGSYHESLIGLQEKNDLRMKELREMMGENKLLAQRDMENAKRSLEMS